MKRSNKYAQWCFAIPRHDLTPRYALIHLMHRHYSFWTGPKRTSKGFQPEGFPMLQPQPPPLLCLPMPPVITIAQLDAEASVGVFHVEAKMSIPDDLQKFCVLECSGCKQKKHTKELKEFDCPKCRKKTTLMYLQSRSHYLPSRSH